MPTATEQFRDGVNYWRVVYVFEFKPDGWNPVKILNEGPRSKEEQFDSHGNSFGIHGDKIVASHDEFKVPDGRMLLLATDGRKLAEGATPITVDFKMYKTSVFEFFNLSVTAPGAGG
jgi:hypothetical protein